MYRTIPFEKLMRDFFQQRKEYRLLEHFGASRVLQYKRLSDIGPTRLLRWNCNKVRQSQTSSRARLSRFVFCHRVPFCVVFVSLVFLLFRDLSLSKSLFYVSVSENFSRVFLSLSLSLSLPLSLSLSRFYFDSSLSSPLPLSLPFFSTFWAEIQQSSMTWQKFCASLSTSTSTIFQQKKEFSEEEEKRSFGKRLKILEVKDQFFLLR